ncbi:DUF6514 family protein [Clostridium sp. LIBA-8841]|uniref:DUF6514 family protein n=1 Tax=Clostridium sp. LIBA-8841 TaxID=2987530 RepID=UPI002AC5D48A|nr:DUF6514 family protein [Clostridium sp. LIBA-8841]MDZ5254619.1 DUF6514 family protein [Clostridium sp. LIBA-8841]
MRVIKNLCKEVKLEDKCYKFCYRLIETCFKGNMVYGIEVERKDFMDEVLTNIERDSIEKISPNKDKVESLIDKLHKYEVSPIHLIDVIGEDVDNYVADFGW